VNSKFALLILAFLITMTLLPSTVMAWTGAVHDYMCPNGYDIDCTIADTHDFQKNYPYGAHQNHLCYDNKTDGMARLVAKYYVKKYYVEGQNDSNLLGAAAHLLQDASCPDHWYPTREIFGSVIVPFAPSWVGTIESQVESYREKGEKNWSIPIEFQGKSINIDDAYLLSQKAYIQNFLSTEPQESLEEIGAQIDARSLWSGLRSTKEWIIVGAIIMAPFLAFEAVQWKRKGKPKRIDLIGTIITIMILAVFLFLLLLIQLFY
jgi:hypothetical protein